MDAGPHAAPLRLAWWARPGALLIGAYPGHGIAAVAERQLDALLDAGLRHFVSLMEEPPRGAAPYDETLRRLARGRGLAVALRAFPIEDHDVPTPGALDGLLDAIDAGIDAGQPAYVHCWGGRGRSGLVGGAWLIRHGEASAEDVVDAIARRRRGLPAPSPETPEQVAFLRSWARTRHTG